MQGDPVESADAQAGVDITAAPTSGKSICIDDLLISTDTDMYVYLQSKTSSTKFAPMYVASYIPIPITFRNGLECPDADEAVQIVTDTAGNISVTPSYHSR